MNKLEHYNKFEASIVEIEEACNFLPDVSTKEGYEASKRIGLDGRKVEKAIDNKRLELKKEAMREADEIHSAGKDLCDRISRAYKPHQEAYKQRDAEVKAAKQAIQDSINLRVEDIRSAVNDCFNLNSSEISAKIDFISNVDIEAGNRTIDLGQARDSVIAKLSEMKAAAIVREAELEDMRKREAELLKQQEEAAKAQAIIDEANRIEQEKIAAERAELEEKERMQREAQAIKQAQEAAKEAERNRIEAEEKAKAKAEAERAANKAHRKDINNAALKDLVKRRVFRRGRKAFY